MRVSIGGLGASGVDVTAYGATGNGSTDDTAAIQKAINAANGQGVYFPAGVYRVTRQLTFPAGGYQGASGAVLKGSTGSQLASAVSNVSIDGLTFDGGGVTFPKAASGVSITNNRFQNILNGGNYNANGIHAPSSFSGQISGNSFQNIYAGGSVGWSEVVGAIWLWNASNTQITNNTFDRIGQAIHVTVTAPYATPSINLTISGNVITRNARYNIEIQGTAVNGLIVSNNHISQLQAGINGQGGISVAVGGTGHQIAGNTLLGPNVGGAKWQNMAIEAMGAGFVIENNYGANWGEAQLIGWSDNAWITRNNTWCGMTDPSNPIIYLEDHGLKPGVDSGNTVSATCSGTPTATPAPTVTAQTQQQTVAPTPQDAASVLASIPSQAWMIGGALLLLMMLDD